MLELQKLIGKDSIPEKDRERLGLVFDDSGKALDPDWFKLWDWTKELETFWHVAFQVYQNRMIRRVNHAYKVATDQQPLEIPALPQVPLFAHVLADYFMDRTPLLSLEVLLSICLGVLRDDDKARRCLEPEASAVIPCLKEPWSLWPLWTQPFLRKYSEQKPEQLQPKTDDSFFIPMNSSNSLDSIGSFGRKNSASTGNKYKFEAAGKEMLSMPLRCLDITSDSTNNR